MIDVPEMLHSRRERGRLTTRGRFTDEDSNRALLVIHEVSGSWAIHGLGAPEVRLSEAELVAPTQKNLARVR